MNSCVKCLSKDINKEIGYKIELDDLMYHIKVVVCNQCLPSWQKNSSSIVKQYALLNTSINKRIKVAKIARPKRNKV